MLQIKLKFRLLLFTFLSPEKIFFYNKFVVRYVSGKQTDKWKLLMNFFIIFATSQFYSKMIWCYNLISCIYVDSNATTELSCPKNFLGVPRALILHFQKYIKNHQQNRLVSVAIHDLFERKRQKNEILYVFRTPPTPHPTLLSHHHHILSPKLLILLQKL